MPCASRHCPGLKDSPALFVWELGRLVDLVLGLADAELTHDREDLSVAILRKIRRLPHLTHFVEALDKWLKFAEQQPETWTRVPLALSSSWVVDQPQPDPRTSWVRPPQPTPCPLYLRRNV